MTLSWVGSRELAFSKTTENLIPLACQVFSLMALLGVGSRVLAPGTQPRSLDFANSKGTNWEKTNKKPIRGIHWED